MMGRRGISQFRKWRGDGMLTGRVKEMETKMRVVVAIMRGRVALMKVFW